MKSPLNNFDIDANYWDVDPQLKVIEPFASLYNEDKTKKKGTSSLYMWAVALHADPESRLFKIGKESKENIIYNDYIKSKKEDFSWDVVKEHIEAYKKLYLTQAQRSLVDWEEKLEERGKFLKGVPYTLEDGDTLDKMLAATSKLYDHYEKILERLADEEAEGQTKGGRIESISEKKII